MTLDEVRRHREKLERALRESIRSFERRTGVGVEAVALHRLCIQRKDEDRETTLLDAVEIELDL